MTTDSTPFVSSVRFSEAELASGVPLEEHIESAIQQFKTHGYVRLENVYSSEHMSRMTAHYLRRYRMYTEGTYKQDRRPLFTVDVEGAFNDPQFYANSLLMPFIRSCLGEECIVGAMSSVLSFPGAPDQFLHRDSQPIFGKDYEVDKGLPPYALTMLIPLVDCNQETGCTKVWPGSHLRNDDEEAKRTPPVEPEVRVGSVLITNSKLLHRGGANCSQRQRPLVYITYHRKWFRDFWGYETRPPVNVSARELRKVPAEYKHLFAWTKDQYATIRVRNAVKRVMPFGLVSSVRKVVRQSAARIQQLRAPKTDSAS